MNAIKIADEKNYNSKIIGKDSMFQAPEVLKQNLFSIQSEIFSAGMIFLFTLIGDKIYELLGNESLEEVLNANGKRIKISKSKNSNFPKNAAFFYSICFTRIL